jgi:signal peptidase
VELLLVASAVGSPLLFGFVLVGGGSMEPTLHRGDLVVFRRGETRPAPGDVVVLAADGHQPYVHRVQEATAGGYVTRGDANPIADLAPVPASDLRGRVCLVLPTSRITAAHLGRYARLANQSDSER